MAHPAEAEEKEQNLRHLLEKKVLPKGFPLSMGSAKELPQRIGPAKGLCSSFLAASVPCKRGPQKMYSGLKKGWSANLADNMVQEKK